MRLLNVKALVSSLSPAYAAALALVAIQVSIGLLYKASQTNGRYAFSASSSVTISELLKFLLSTYLFFREWKKRTYAEVAQEPDIEIKETPAAFKDDENDAESSSSRLLEEEDFLATPSQTQSAPVRRFDAAGFMAAVREEIPAETRYGFVHLALFYVIINNTIFVLFRLADPGTIQLIKSGTTLITAVVMIFALGTKIVGGQWIAIVLQVCGIVVTQYGPNGGATYPLSTYLLLVFQTTLSAVSSVYNQKLCKSVDGSLHVMNMTLYAAGCIINLVVHVVIRFINADEPGFFTGYANLGAVMVIISNVFVGLAMTAVYKYADALIKCFATAISTAILLYISPILFNINFSFLVIPGTLTVFLATWLYMEATPKPPAQATLTPAEVPAERSFFSRLMTSLSPHGIFRKVGLAIAVGMAFVLIGMLTYWRTHMIPAPNASEPPVLDTDFTNATMPIVEYVEPEPVVPVFESPFKNTMAFIRLNADLPKRVETLYEGYSPYFHSIHISMPESGHLGNETTIERDYCDDSFIIYDPVRATMKLILEDPAYDDVEGLLFFHFDAWVEPLSFHDMPMDKLWVLDKGSIPYLCMRDVKEWVPDWMWFGAKEHERAKMASTVIKSYLPNYDVDPEQFCVGWSDMYYLPRRFFADFQHLSTIIASARIMHEIAIPTLWNIIDRTYSPHPSRSVIYRWSDCWGGCCDSGVKPGELAQKRCGHKLDYLNWETTRLHYDLLKTNAPLLGQPVPFKDLPEVGIVGGSRRPMEEEIEEMVPEVAEEAEEMTYEEAEAENAKIEDKAKTGANAIPKTGDHPAPKLHAKPPAKVKAPAKAPAHRRAHGRH
ncbi:hypothetical protein EJ06DRAFT_484915 [Trichodelitschia bisporula]|uniref:UDP-galactose transporter n=1 Tax=Trichodelitschia bisporula TaxID=703511 RepID=A0A6G1HI16_9PEZI|nr:hypothetical protein EJ06DRAFT_484915 [Trichodelitschia bisporula]